MLYENLFYLYQFAQRLDQRANCQTKSKQGQGCFKEKLKKLTCRSFFGNVKLCLRLCRVYYPPPGGIMFSPWLLDQ